MSVVRPLSLDHITVADTMPSQLVETAAAVGCSGVCAFLHSMPVLPDMPEFTLVGETQERQRTRDAMRATGMTLDLVYPFTLAGRTIVGDFEPALESAAWLGARLANVLCYDRDPVRRIERLSELAELARGYGIALALEFYPPSQTRSLAEALTLIDALEDADIGITLDLLHLVRAGEMPDALPLLTDPRIRIAQISDGPSRIDAGQAAWEAGLQRLLPGTGTFDVAAFVRALPATLRLSVEIPQQDAMQLGVSVVDRAAAAVFATRSMTEDSRPLIIN